MFFINGIIDNKECKLMYSGGILTGDAIALEKARKENKKNYGYIGVFPSVANKNYLKNESSAFALIKDYVFNKVINIQSDWYENEKVNTIY